jgi:hypothetical protein
MRLLIINLIMFSCLTPTTGHLGYQKTLYMAKHDFYWPGMMVDIQHYIMYCELCHKNKHETLLPISFVQPFPIPNRVWAEISMDFIEGLHLSHGHNTT